MSRTEEWQDREAETEKQTSKREKQKPRSRPARQRNGRSGTSVSNAAEE